MLRQYELIEKIRAYDPDADEALINRAYVFSMKAHGAQVRASGDPYFSHPIEVAGILTDLKLDDETIVTAILHDTIEDTVATHEQIEKLFGDSVARLVDGVTKLSKIEAQSENERQAENLRKFLLALSGDIRVLLVKLADRLHNMRTLRHIKNEDKRRRIARETMDIYAPLAERIGMYEMMTEMQTLAFRELEPDAYASITRRLDQLHAAGGDLVSRIGLGLQLHLADHGLDAEVTGREKHPFSIWKKMAERHISFEQLSDVMAFRVIVDSVEDCYRALGLIHERWPMVPGRFKDFISTPKRNGYRSLHTSVIHDSKMRIEVQIRSRDMHAQAERGLAAHWAYKEGKPAADLHVPWVDELVEILEHADSPEELLEHTRMAMYQDRIFAFTPKGELIQLPKGATPVDFAYAVHTDLGDQTVGAKVNGRVVPLRTLLENGDQVEILASEAQHPQPSWLRFVATGKARSSIRRFVR
ncbi:MAG TPA: RelA/SpoT family protein, partial [Sphingomicrobium sp.]|nr:RelA/SpoT family protein [Sphingomicrobium sp.]